MLQTTHFKSFRDLIAWQIAHELTLEIYRYTAEFPKYEIYGLSSQLRRAAASTAANIVEGSKRRTTADLCRFLNIAEGSNEEAKYFLLLAKDLGYMTVDHFTKCESLTDRIGALLYRLISSLQSS